jgi:hypothetical protein
LTRRALTAIAAAFLLLQVALGVAMISNTSWRKRQQARAILDDRVDKYVSTNHREPLIDIGVELRVVVQDVAGDELIPGMPRMRVVHRSEHGGIVNVRTPTLGLVAPSAAPRTWFCSEDQYEVILHADELPLGLLVYGSEGAGKTELMPHVALHALARAPRRRPRGRADGADEEAPVDVRRRVLRASSRAVGTRTASRSASSTCATARRSSSSRRISRARPPARRSRASTGFGAGGDEFQDSFEKATDIDARGRSRTERPLQAGSHHAPRRTRRRGASSRSSCSRRRKRRQARSCGGSRSCSAGARRSSRRTSGTKLATYSKREYHRRVEPLDDLPPELAVYYGWQRERNLVPLPRIATDVTVDILANYPSYICQGARFTLLACHDPGNIINVTEVLRLVMFGDVPTWMVVGELKTRQTNAVQHAEQLVEYLQRTFGVERRIRGRDGRPVADPDSSKALIFVDPHGKGESQTDYQTVYGAFQAAKLDVLSPAGITGKIKRRARVDMVNRLLGDNSNGVPRLVVARDERGNTLAPELVGAFESMVKRPGDDDPEGVRRKDEDDKTHAPAAIGYGLWSFEQQAMTERTVEVARAAAWRRRV